MAVLALPLNTDLGATPHYTFACELEGKTYTFEFFWNDRDSFWYMQLGDSQENPIVGFQKITLGISILGRFRQLTGMPPGQFVAIDTTGQDLDAGLTDLGARVQVWYIDSTSVTNLLTTGVP